MAKIDPWDIDPKESQKKKKEYSGGSKGIPCPNRNMIEDKVCKVCDKMKLWWNKPEGTPERETYKKKKATFNFFLNVVFDADKSKSIILEVGKNAGDSIINGINDPIKNWKSIAHPKAGKGLITCIKKFQKDGNNSYDVYVATDKPDWDISEDVIKNLPNLDRESIIKMIENDEFTDENYMKISTLKMDETLTFRVCPHWDAERRTSPPIEFLARHWWTSADEIKGDTPVALITDNYEESESAFGADKKSENSAVNDEKEQKVSEPKAMKCFGDAKYFDINDTDCSKDCENFELCKVAVKKSMKQ